MPCGDCWMDVSLLGMQEFHPCAHFAVAVLPSGPVHPRPVVLELAFTLTYEHPQRSSLKKSNLPQLPETGGQQSLDGSQRSEKWVIVYIGIIFRFSPSLWFGIGPTPFL